MALKQSFGCAATSCTHKIPTTLSHATTIVPPLPCPRASCLLRLGNHRHRSLHLSRRQVSSVGRGTWGHRRHRRSRAWTGSWTTLAACMRWAERRLRLSLHQGHLQLHQRDVLVRGGVSYAHERVVHGGSFTICVDIFSTFDCAMVYARQKEDPWYSIVVGRKEEPSRKTHHRHVWRNCPQAPRRGAQSLTQEPPARTRLSILPWFRSTLPSLGGRGV